MNMNATEDVLDLDPFKYNNALVSIYLKLFVVIHLLAIWEIVTDMLSVRLMDHEEEKLVWIPDTIVESIGDGKSCGNQCHCCAS